MFGLKDLRGYVKKGFRKAKNAVGAISHSEDTTQFDIKVCFIIIYSYVLYLEPYLNDL